MHGFQCLRDAAVQHAALWRTDLSIRYLAQLIVREVIAVRTVFAHDPFVPEFVQRTDGSIGVGVADADQEVEQTLQRTPSPMLCTGRAFSKGRFERILQA
jgi:hypothetical protein